jgi:hypothetical protein
MSAITVSDGLLILATIAGPILAVQAQKWVERASERRNQKRRIFEVLMTTRATRLANEHVQALNMIDIAFVRPKALRQSATEKAVIDAWRLYVDKLSENQKDSDAATLRAWTERCDEFFTDLMFALSNALGYNFDKVQLKRGAYYPMGHGQTEELLKKIQSGLASVLSGGLPLSMRVVEFPVSEEILKLQVEVLERQRDALSGNSLAVTVKASDLEPTA